MKLRPLDFVAAAAVCAVWLAARVAFFNGYYTEDAPGYVGDAIAIATGTYGPRNHVNGLNVGTYAPVALPLWLFGKTDAALSVWPMLCSLLGMASLAGASTLLFGRVFGVLAALLYATHPGDVFFSTVVMPDAIQAGWLSVSCFLIVLAHAPATRASAGRILFAAGQAMAFCHLIRANGVLLLPVGLCAIVAAGALWRGEAPVEIGRRTVTYVAGWVGILALEALVYWWLTGDALFRYHVVDGHYGRSQSIAQFGLNASSSTIPYSALPPLLWHDLGGWGSLNQDQAYHALLFTFAVLALVLGAFAWMLSRRAMPPALSAGMVVAAVWLAWPLLYHQYGSQSLTHYVPIHRLSRHLVVYAPGAIFAIVSGCAAVWWTLRSAPARALAGTVAVTALAVHLSFDLAGVRIAHAAYHHIKDTYTGIRDRLPPGTTLIVADPGDLGFFDFWLNPLGERRVDLRAFASYQSCAELTEGVVLTFSNPGWQGLAAPSIQEVVARLPCLLWPPPHWRMQPGLRGEKVYVVGRPDPAQPISPDPK